MDTNLLSPHAQELALTFLPSSGAIKTRTDLFSLFNQLDEKIASAENASVKLDLELLYAMLLNDLLSHIRGQVPEDKAKKTLSGWPGTLRFALLVSAGTIYAACDGVDGIITILGLIPHIPLSFLLVVGAIFAFLSIGVFYGFYLPAFSENETELPNHQTDLLDAMIDEANLAKELTHHLLADYASKTKSQEELGQMKRLLQQIYKKLETMKSDYDKKLTEPWLQAITLAVSASTSVLFFGYGFFVGQFMALLLMTLLSASTSATFWPVMLISTLVGLASLIVYWLIDRKGLEKFVGRCLGVDQDKIEQLPEKKETDKQLALLEKIESAEGAPPSAMNHPFFNPQSSLLKTDDDEDADYFIGYGS